jgi:UDP-GlcNAc:undecaprenyl-phosphate GlcNAc-1-phosphate transferase
VFIVGTINSFNLLDGLDGLVSGISLLVFILLFFVGLNLLDTFSLVVLASIIGCLIGFLKYNGYPARIFLGDSGSFLLGYLVVSSVLILSINKQSNVLDLTFPVILLAVPIADTLKVMVERIISGKHPFIADRTHIHHIVFSKNITHKTTVFVITIYSLIFAANAMVYRYYSETLGIAIFFVLILPLIFASQILQFMIDRESLVKIGRTVNRFPQFLLNYYKNFILPLVSLFTIVYFVILFTDNNHSTSEFLIPSLIILILLVVFTILNYNKNKVLTDVIVFFNILIFFIINQPTSILYTDIYDLPVLGNLNYNLLIIAILLPVIGFFLVFRDRIIPQRGMFFSGLDLVIILIIILLSITSSLIPISRSYIIADTIFRSYLLYIFYKIIINIESKYRIYLYAFSFLIVVSSQVLFLFS